MILGGGEFHLEIIALVGRQGDCCIGNDVELRLPLRGGCGRVTQLIHSTFVGDIDAGNLDPVRSIELMVGMGCIGRFPEVGVCVVIEGRSVIAGIFGSGLSAFLDKNHLPGDRTAAIAGGSVPNQLEGCLGELCDSEACIIKVVVVGNVADHCSGRQGKRLAIKLICGFLLLPCVVEIGRCASIVKLGYADVHIDFAILTGIEDILSVVCEGKFVVIKAVRSLFPGGRAPPAGGVIDSLAAGQVAGLIGSHHPCAYDRAVGRGLCRRRGKDVLPCNRAAAVTCRSVPDKGHILVGDALDVKFGIADIVVIWNIRERSACGQREHYLVAFHGEGIRNRRLVNRQVIVGIVPGFCIRGLSNADIHVNKA